MRLLRVKRNFDTNLKIFTQISEQHRDRGLGGCVTEARVIANKFDKFSSGRAKLLRRRIRDGCAPT